MYRVYNYCCCTGEKVPPSNSSLDWLLVFDIYHLKFLTASCLHRSAFQYYEKYLKWIYLKENVYLAPFQGFWSMVSYPSHTEPVARQKDHDGKHITKAVCSLYVAKKQKQTWKVGRSTGFSRAHLQKLPPLGPPLKALPHPNSATRSNQQMPSQLSLCSALKIHIKCTL